MTSRSLFAVLALLVVGPLVAAPRYRLGIAPFKAPDDVTKGQRTFLASLVQEAVQRDGRMRVVEADIAEILHLVAVNHRLYRAVDPRTVPRLGKLAAPNYHLTGEVVDAVEGRALLLQIWDLEVGELVSATGRLPETETQLRDMIASMVSDLLVFVPRTDASSAEGTVTVTVDEGVAAHVKFYADAEWRAVPARSPRMPPGVHAAAIEPDDQAFLPRVEFFRVQPNRDTVHAVKLEKRKIAVTLRDIPQNAAIFIDDAYVADPRAPVTLEAGSHEVYLLAPDGTVQRRPFDVGLHHPLSVSLAVPADELALEATVRRIDTIEDVKPLGVAIHGRDVVIVTPDAVIAVDPLSATRRWTNLAKNNIGAPVIAGGALYVPRWYYASYERPAGRAGSVTVEERRVALRRIDLDRGSDVGDVLDRKNDLRVLDASDEAVLVNADGALHVAGVGRQATFRRLGRTPYAVDVSTARFGAEGLVMLDRERRHIVSFFPDGQSAWAEAIDGKIARLFPVADDVVVQTEEKTLHRFSRGGARLWSRTVQKAVSFAVESEGALHAIASDGTFYRIGRDGESTTYAIHLGDLRVLTACRAEAGGRLVLVAADHRVALFNPVSMQVEWHQDFDDRVLAVPTTKGMTVVATDANVTLFGTSARQSIVGWIDRVSPDEGTVDVRLSVPMGSDEHLAARRFADYRGKRTDAPAIEVDPSSVEERNGVTRMRVASTAGLQAGDVLSRGGTLRVDLADEKAFVWVDASFECRGGCAVTGLDPGPHEVVVAREGFERWTRSVTVARTAEVIVPQLKALPDVRYLDVETRPAGADVIVEGERLALTEDGRASRWTNRNRQEWVNVRVSKPGYLAVDQQVRNDLQTTLDVPLLPAPPYLRFSAGWATSNATELLGWPESAITSAGVAGAPLRREATVPLLGRLEAAWTFGRYSPFGAAEMRRDAAMAGAGLRMLTARNARWLGEISIEAGAYWSSSEGSNKPSENDRQGGAAGSVATNEDRPLEEWSHPIRNVFVENEGPVQYELAVVARPLVHTFARLSVGMIDGMRLHGTALVVDPSSGHLVRDPARSYDLTMSDGWYGAIEAHIGADVLVPFITIRNGYALFARYERKSFDLGPLHESRDLLAAGVSYTLYQGKARR